MNISERFKSPRDSIDFDAVNRAAMSALPSLLRRWLPDGKQVGREYEARNPRRADNRPGSFRINTITGKWSDFATGDKGGDLLDLLAYVDGVDLLEAGKILAQWTGVNHDWSD